MVIMIMMDFLFSYITFFSLIPLTDCKKEHSRLLSITCHSLALHILFFVEHSGIICFLPSQLFLCVNALGLHLL